MEKLMTLGIVLSFVKYLFYAVAGLGAFTVVVGSVGIALSAMMAGLSMTNRMLGIKTGLLKLVSLWESRHSIATTLTSTAQKVATATTTLFSTALSGLNIRARALAVFGAIGSFIRGFGVATAFAAAKQWLLNIAMRANPIGLLITGISALVAGVVWAYNKFGWFRDGVNSVWEFIKKIFSFSPIGLVVNAWRPVFEWLSSKFEWLGSAVDKLKSIGSSIKGFFGFGGDEKEDEKEKEKKEHKSWFGGWFSDDEEKKPLQKIGQSAKKVATITTVGATLATASPNINIPTINPDVKIPTINPDVKVPNIPTIVPDVKVPNINIPTIKETINTQKLKTFKELKEEKTIITQKETKATMQNNYNYTININVTGNSPQEIVSKLQAVLPSLIEEIESNKKDRMLNDTM